MWRAGLVAVVVSAAAFAEDDPDELFRQGLDLFDQRAYAAARRKFEDALAIFGKRGFTGACAGMESQIASCYWEEGDYEEALRHNTKYCELMDALPAVERGLEYKRDVAMARIEMANCLRTLERYDEALTVLRAAREEIVAFHRGGDHDDVALALHNEASCLLEMGRPMDALPVFQKAARVREHLGLDRIPDTPDQETLLGINDYAGTLNACAACFMRLGNGAEAEALLRRSWELRERLLPAPHPILASMQANLGACLKLEGKLDEAEPWLERSVSMLEALYPNGHPDLAQRINDLGSCVEARRGPREALPYYRRALAMLLKALPEDHSDVARTRSNLGLCLMRLAAAEKNGELEGEGLACLEAAAESGLRTGVPEAHTWLSNLGSTLLDLGRLDEAVAPFEAAVERVEAYRAWARSLPALERASYFGQTRTFDPFQGLALVAHRQGRPRDALLWLERGRAWAVLDLLDSPEADLVGQAAHGASPEDRSKILAAQEHLRELDGKLAKATRRADLAVRRGDVKEIARARQDLADVRAEHAGALRERAVLLQDALPVLRSGASVEAPSLGPGELALVYSLSSDGCFVVAVGEEIRSFSLSGPEGKEIREPSASRLVRDYLDALAEERKAPAEAIVARRKTAALALYRMLVPEPLRKEIASARWTVVVPDGLLHDLPFETLALDESGTHYWLDDGPPVAIDRAFSILSRCRAIAAGQDAAAPLAVVALGDPAFDAAGAEGFAERGARRLERLPGTRREAEAIRKVLGHDAPLTVLLGKDATEAALWKAAPKARVLHLGTHHIAEPGDQGRFSRLVLSPPADPTPEDDGALTLLDLIERWGGRLAECRLVVLSACESTRGYASRADGVFAMPLGFLHAGSPRVVASLWPVPDEAPVQMMADFYRHLANGESPLAALTEAKKAWRKRDPSPARWGAFVMIGAPD